MDSLKFVISEIIKYKSATHFFEEEDSNIDRDSIQNVHQEKIIKYSNQSVLEIILDTTKSIDLKYYCAQALVSYPSDKISDVFFDILFDTNCYYELKVKNSCLTYVSNLSGVPYGRAWHILEDTDSSLDIKNNLKRELFEMDSIWIKNRNKSHSAYDDDGEPYRFTEKRNKTNKNLKIAKWIIEYYFINEISNLNKKTYGINCGYVGSGPELRSQMEYSLFIRDSTLLDYEIKKRIYYFNLWLRSTDLVLKTYGAEALIRLQNNGVILSEEQLILINSLKKRNKKVPTCHGCIYGDRISIKDALKPFNLK